MGVLQQPIIRKWIQAIVDPLKLSIHGERWVKKLGYRKYVGGYWEEIGPSQLLFLVQQGLKPSHVLLDLGCGALRGGKHFIQYLNPGNYLGLEKEELLVQCGLEKELSSYLILEKKPEIKVNSNFDFETFSKTPDYICAFSIFTHLTLRDIEQCLRNLALVSKPNTIFFASYFESSVPFKNAKRSADHVAFYYPLSKMKEVAKLTGWKVEPVSWFHDKNQKMLRFQPRQPLSFSQ